MSSLTGGFDLFAQISAGAIKQMLQSRAPLPSLGLQNLNTPFTLNAPAGPSPSLTLNVDDIQIKLAADTVNLTFVFKQGQFGLPKSDLVQISGTLTLALPFVLMDVVPQPKVPAKQLTLQMKKASATFVVTGGPAKKELDPVLLNAAMTVALQKEQDYNLPVRFSVVPGQGSLVAFVFSSLQVHTLDSQNSLGLFGNFAGTSGSVQQIAGSLLQGTEGVGMAISAAAFQSQVICPQLAKALGLGVAQLPTSCGSGQPTISGVALKLFTTTFTAGSLLVEFALAKETSEYALSCKGHGTVTLDVQGTSILPNFHWSDPDVDTELKGWSKIIGYVIPVVGITAAVFSTIGDAILSVIGGKVLNDLTDNISPLNLANIVRGLPLSIDHTSIQPDGIALGGTLLVKPGIKEQQLVQVGGSTEVAPIGSGEQVPVQPPVPIPHQTFQATEYTCNSTATYGVKTQLIPLPYQLKWSVVTNDGETVTLPASGQVTLKKMSASYHAGNGANLAITKDVVLTVAANGNQIDLTNQPDDGNYSFPLTATLTLPDGTVKRSTDVVDMTGDMLVMPPEYDKAMQAFQTWMNRIGAGRAVAVPRKPNPGDIRQIMQAMLSDPSPEAANWYAALPVLTGSNYNRAINAASLSSLTLDSAGLTRLRIAPQLQTDVTLQVR